MASNAVSFGKRKHPEGYENDEVISRSSKRSKLHEDEQWDMVVDRKQPLNATDGSIYIECSDPHVSRLQL